MKEFNRFWYTPPHQRKGKPKVEFELMPLDQRTWLTLKSEIRGRRISITLTPDGYLEAFRYGVVGWRGYEVEFSEEAKLDMVTGVANRHVAIWQEQIAAELMRRVLLEDSQAKNS
jgi:hypothetical protein